MDELLVVAVTNVIEEPAAPPRWRRTGNGATGERRGADYLSR
jgi:hypothetical protein